MSVSYVGREPSSVKREAILEAALELFAERGFHGTPVPLVAERAGVGAGTLYNYFESKEALVNALYQRWKLELGRTLMEDFPVAAPMREKFHHVWTRLAYFASHHPRAFEFLEFHHHGDYLDASSKEVEELMLGPLRELITQAQREQVFKKMPPEVIGAITYGAFLGLVQMQRKGLHALTPKVLDDAEQAVWEAIRR